MRLKIGLHLKTQKKTLITAMFDVISSFPKMGLQPYF